MKINVLLSSLILTIGINANASDNNIYFGYDKEFGSGSQTRTYDAGGVNETEYDTSANRFKLGFILESQNRFEISINNISAEYTSGKTFNANQTVGDRSSEFSGFDLDWLFTIGENKTVLPYIDLGFGIYNNDEIKGTNNSGDVESATALAFNLGLGLISEVNDNFELEIGYKYKGLAWNLEDPTVKESIRYFYFGGNVKF